MEEVVNGTEVIEASLNSCLLATTESPNSIDFAIKIDFLKLFSSKNHQQCCVIDEILDMTDNFDSARELVKHPVIASFIFAKWAKIKKYYYVHALLYMAFLLCYSIMVYQLFGGGGNRVPVLKCENTANSPNSPNSPNFPNSTAELRDSNPLSWETGHSCRLELWFQIPMVAILTVLTLYDIYQLCRLRLFEDQNHYSHFTIIFILGNCISAMWKIISNGLLLDQQ